MRYFYHYGYYLGDLFQHWVSTNELIEVNSDSYDEIVRREKEIIESTGRPGHHFPVCIQSGIPKNKVLRKQL